MSKHSRNRPEWSTRALWRRGGAVLAALVLAGTAVLTHTTAAAASTDMAGAKANTGAEFQAALDALTEAGLPGSYAQVRRDGRTWAGASGVAYVETGAPMRPYFRHRVGSVTKTFVATALLQLVGERRLSLDTSVDRLLPRFGLDPAITVRMLLNHTSGIGNYTSALDSLEEIAAWQTRTWTPDELVELGMSFPDTGAPGESFSYSNTNYILAGLIIERVTGNDAEKEIERRILKPLKLRDTSFPGRDPKIRGPHAAAYMPWPDSPTGLRDFSVYNMTWAWTAGEVISTMDDLNTFYRALIQGRLLKPAQQAALLTTVAMDPQAPEAGGYGLGIYYLDLPCGRVWGHDGGVIGQVTQVLTTPDGRTQLSWGTNFSWYFLGVPAVDEAFANLILTVFCGTGAAADTNAQTRVAPGTVSGQLPFPGVVRF